MRAVLFWPWGDGDGQPAVVGRRERSEGARWVAGRSLVGCAPARRVSLARRATQQRFPEVPLGDFLFSQVTIHTRSQQAGLEVQFCSGPRLAIDTRWPKEREAKRGGRVLVRGLARRAGRGDGTDGFVTLAGLGVRYVEEMRVHWYDVYMSRD